MNSTRPVVLAVSLILSGQIASAQEMSRYRAYALGSSLDSVITGSGARADNVTTLHERPARIQELQWRAPYVGSGNTGNTLPDPVREIMFSFYNDALYQVIVKYDTDRTAGLTNNDIVESISASYGAPTLATAGTRLSPPEGTASDSVVLARWESAESRLTLVREAYPLEFQLILISKSLGTSARSAIREAIRLDRVEAPRREAEQRKKEAGDASATREKTRITNKAAFRP